MATVSPGLGGEAMLIQSWVTLFYRKEPKDWRSVKHTESAPWSGECDGCISQRRGERDRLVVRV